MQQYMQHVLGFRFAKTCNFLPQRNSYDTVLVPRQDHGHRHGVVSSGESQLGQARWETQRWEKKLPLFLRCSEEMDLTNIYIYIWVNYNISPT